MPHFYFRIANVYRYIFLNNNNKEDGFRMAMMGSSPVSLEMKSMDTTTATNDLRSDFREVWIWDTFQFE